MNNFHSHLVSEDVFNYGWINKNFYSILEDSIFLFRKESFLPVKRWFGQGPKLRFFRPHLVGGVMIYFFLRS
jgi:hypothetical protein